MLKEKCAILSHLRKLRADDPTKAWRLLSVGIGSAIGMAAAVAVAPGKVTPSPITIATVVEQLSTPATEVNRDDLQPFIREDRIRGGETLAGALRRLGVTAGNILSQAQRAKFVRELSGTFRPGANLTVATTAEGALQSATLCPPGSETCILINQRDGQLQSSGVALKLDSRIHMQSGVVQSSLFAAMDAAGLPDSIAEALSRIFGDDMDFHTDLRRGDRFSVIYEVYYYQGRAVRTGRILAAEFINQGVRHAAYLFRQPDGSDDYFSQDGQSRKEGFLRSPLEFSRVSSGFSMRLHPILGTWREHKGVTTRPPKVQPSRQQQTESSSLPEYRTATAISSSCAIGTNTPLPMGTSAALPATSSLASTSTKVTPLVMSAAPAGPLARTSTTSSE